MNPLLVLRWLHILAGAAWLGEVLTINLVIIPSLKALSHAERPPFIRRVFPRLFRLASLLSLTSILSGLSMSYIMTGWEDLGTILASRWGSAILIGGSLGLALTLFHFLVESRLEPLVLSLDDDSSPETLEQVSRFLRIVPRAGLLVLFAVFLMMMYAARGL